MLCVSLLTYGGLAGGLQRPAVVIEGSTLTAAEQQQLRELVRALETSPPPAIQGPGAGRDVQGYVITVEEPGKPPVEYEANDLTRNQAFATLSRWIQTHRAGS